MCIITRTYTQTHLYIYIYVYIYMYTCNTFYIFAAIEAVYKDMICTAII